MSSESTPSAVDIVLELAEWSNRYPRSRIYHSASQDKIDGELIAIEEKAKTFQASFSPDIPPTAIFEEDHF